MNSSSDLRNAVEEAISSAVTPAPLASADQQIILLEELKPQWVTVPFKKPIKILWDWNHLLGDATARTKDPNLAVMGLVMSWTCEASSILVEGLFRSLAFDHLWSSHYLASTLQRNAVSEPARTFAHKAIEVDGEIVHIVCAVFKGTTTIKDALTDVKSVKDGFLGAGKNCADALRTYVHGIEGATDGNTVLFITGHSLGAATANVVGRLTKDLAEDHMRFVYTYASPNYACEGDEDSGYEFPNFRTFTNVADAVPTVPPNFPKLGIEYRYDRASFDDEQRSKFETAYTYFRDVAFDEDSDPIGLGITKISDEDLAVVLRNHLAATYMAFIFSEFSDEQLSLESLQEADETQLPS